MRRGEIMGLRWTHVDRERWMIRLPADMTKEGKPKRIPINHHVKTVLDALPFPIREDLPVFTYQSKAIGNSFKKSFMNACRKAGIPFGRKTREGFIFHDIRSTVKANMLRAGVDSILRNMILGHSVQGMDAYYLKPTDEDLRAAMDRYTAWIDAQLENVDQTVDQEV